MPRNLSKEAEDMWATITENLPTEIWNKADQGMLEGCCRWWAVYLVAIDSLDIAVAQKAWTAFYQAAGQLGLSPVARAKLQAPPPKEVDELDQLMSLKVTG
jgi:phage terminase small subunit